tara:strand:- start:8300 stop:10240 length:1941 start_codon:yes stop_codon:yes gene_type:complete
MISYFKYTSGESFTLSGRNFTGLFNVVDGRAFSGKSLTETSTPLSSNGTFIGNAFEAEKEFDRTAGPLPRLANILIKPHISPRDIVDQVFIDKNLDILNNNNLNLYALNIISNPEILNFQSTSKGGDTFMLCLTSLSESREESVNMAKDNSAAENAMPFSTIKQKSDGVLLEANEVPAVLEGIDKLDGTNSSALVVNRDETFNYFTVTSTETLVFSGSFMRNSPFTFREDITSQIPPNTKLIYDNNTDTLYNLGKDIITDVDGEQKQVDRLVGYDFSFYNTCGTWKIKDVFTFKNPIVRGNFKIGNELKGALVQLDGGEIAIELTNKYSNEFFGYIKPPPPRQGRGLLPGFITINEVIVDFDIRDTDDSVLVLTKVENRLPPPGSDGPFNVYHVDSELVENYILGLNQAPNLVRTYPPSGLAGVAIRGVGTAIKFSESDSNIFILKESGSISTRFISNPEYPAGFLSVNNLQFLPNSYYNSTKEFFNNSRLTFNSNALPSNYYNYINFSTEENGGNVFYLLQNTGRIYLTKTNNLIYDNILPLDLANTYDRELGCESSLGISLNSEIESILKDTLKIYTNLALIITGETIESVPVLGRYTSYPNIDVDFRDFEFHENEEMNYNVISRVFDSLYNLQKNVLDSILNN